MIANWLRALGGVLLAQLWAPLVKWISARLHDWQKKKVDDAAP